MINSKTYSTIVHYPIPATEFVHKPVVSEKKQSGDWDLGFLQIIPSLCATAGGGPLLVPLILLPGLFTDLGGSGTGTPGLPVLLGPDPGPGLALVDLGGLSRSRSLDSNLPASADTEPSDLPVGETMPDGRAEGGEDGIGGTGEPTGVRLRKEGRGEGGVLELSSPGSLRYVPLDALTEVFSSGARKDDGLGDALPPTGGAGERRRLTGGGGAPTMGGGGAGCVGSWTDGWSPVIETFVFGAGVVDVVEDLNDWRICLDCRLGSTWKWIGSSVMLVGLGTSS